MKTTYSAFNKAYHRVADRPERFITICQCVLLVTGLVKLLSYFFLADLPAAKDKVFPGLTGRDLLLFAGLCELGVAAALTWLRLLPQLLLLYWLGLGIVHYRIANHFLGGSSCSCLGKLSENGGPLEPLIKGLLIAFLVLMVFGAVFYVMRLPSLRMNRGGSFGSASELLYDS